MLCCLPPSITAKGEKREERERERERVCVGGIKRIKNKIWLGGKKERDENTHVVYRRRTGSVLKNLQGREQTSGKNTSYI